MILSINIHPEWKKVQFTLFEKENGLNDNGEGADIKTIENKVNMFCGQITKQQR